MFTLSQKKDAYKKLSAEAQEFIMSNDTTKLTENILKQDSGLYNEKFDLADSEVWYALLGLQTLPEAITNIAKIAGQNINDFSKLRKSLEENVFNFIPKNGSLDNNIDKLKEIEEKAIKMTEQNSDDKIQANTLNSSVTKTSKVGDDFEQILLNQARAMQPARPKDETGRVMNYESGIMGEEKKPNINSSTNEKPSYPSGIDPYREPIN